MTRKPLTHRALTLAIAMGALAFAANTTAEVRTMIVTSDPQYPWTDRMEEEPSIPETESERNRRSEELITEQYTSIAAYRAARPGEDIPVFINGDITAHGHGWQRSVMARLLPILGDNVHLGLGNHDYKNNVTPEGGYNSAACYNNGCTRDSIQDLVRHVTDKAGKVAFDYSANQGVFKTLHQGSLAYATKARGLDRVLNIQLNYSPLYEVTFESTEALRVNRYELVSPLPWLRNLLETKLEKPTFGDWKDREYDFAIIHMHDPDHFDGNFARLVINADVPAIFAGHLHKDMGLYRTIGSVPVFLSGSASQRTYLIVEHDTDEDVLRVYGVRENSPGQKQLIRSVPVHRNR
ncbi:calcineurin-like phosphoesterase family protein [Luteibacter sp. OK325]|uniref:metallophosphoesterase n=1 Tax=Luteibacter sp. OK325 TaxID=2135670 RepID=UPI000D4D957C|nr:metallophosphoesterase [Luteibacter sp. OK325]PTR33383.1 calcineurin-like phosphoesterase family protein [Luteibacter sp. OK325]